ncbi:MAG: hypothetical protein LBV36_08090 [Chromatiales bacterium]|jgi:hypothetical protein|nr:hypothetical protein [Chromatiales bacterium]
MNAKLGSILLLIASFVSAPIALADANAIKEMAQIVKTLDHQPTASDQDALRKIVASDASTPGERAIAGALLQMKHQISAADREKLQKVKDDTAATSAEHELADIVMSINHHASPQDKERLDQL